MGGKQYMAERLAKEGICLVVKDPELIRKYFPTKVIHSAFQKCLVGLVHAECYLAVEVGE